MEKDEKIILWSGRIQELRSSGQSMKEWCMEQKIPYSTMGYWLRKLEAQEQEPENEPVFAKLPSEKEIAGNNITAGSSPIQIFISENIRIEIADSCCPELLQMVLKVLKTNA